jgi:hypothetical protein
VSDRGMSLATLAQEYVWLWDVRHGQSVQELADRDQVSPRRIRFGISRARYAEEANPCPDVDGASIRPPRVVPLFPIVPFDPGVACAHKRDLAKGSFFCCMVCHRSGIDGHPALQRDPLTDPAPEPKAPPISTKGKKAKKKETRRERRARLFGESPAN